MIDTLIFAVEAPFTDRDYERFGIKRLIARGFRVQVWDLSDVLHADIIELVEVPDRKQWEGCTRFSARDELGRAIAGLPRTAMVLCLVRYAWGTTFFYRALSARSIPYAVMVVNILPPPASATVETWAGRLGALFRRIGNSPVKAGILHVLNRVLLAAFPLIGVSPARLCILGGSRCAEAIGYPVRRSTRYVWTHALDFDLYLSIRDRAVPEERSLGVFLDEYLPFHPDLLFAGNPAPCPADEYYPQLRQFFDYLETRFGVRVAVAAHPKSQYGSHQDYFGGRPVIQGSTPEFVQRAGFVILHASTSLNFAILFRKPVIFITNHRIDSNIGICRIGAILSTMASILGKTPITLDEPYSFDWNRELAVDGRAYARYRDWYIKKEGTEERNTWEIVADAILSEGKREDQVSRSLE